MQDTQLYKAFPIVRRLAVEKKAPRRGKIAATAEKGAEECEQRWTSISFSVSPSLHTQIVLTDFETNNLVYMKTDPDSLIADHVSAYLKNLIAHFNLAHLFIHFLFSPENRFNAPIFHYFFLFYPRWVSILGRDRELLIGYREQADCEN